MKDSLWGRKGAYPANPRSWPSANLQPAGDESSIKEQHKADERDKSSPADHAGEVQRRGLGLGYPGRPPGGGSGERALKDEEDMDKG